MPEVHERAFAFGDDLRHSWEEVAEMIELRRKLAAAECQSDLSASKRLAWMGGIGAVVTLTGLPVAVMSVALYLDEHVSGVSFPWITLSGGALLVVAGLFTMLLSYLRFRRDFLGFRETLAELREDAVWLREWIGGSGDADELDET